MMATLRLPSRNAVFSCRLSCSCVTPRGARDWTSVLPSRVVTMRVLRPVSSATSSTPKCETSRSRALPGILISSKLRIRASRISSACEIRSNPFTTGRCRSSRSRAISCGVLTSVSISRPAFTSRSMASLALASPVESKPITTHSPLASAASACSSRSTRHST